FQAEDGIRDKLVTGVQTCALPICAGKTTAFYMIVGLVPCDAGRIRLDDTDITLLPMHRRAQLGLGYLPQEASVFRKLTVENNVQIGRASCRERGERPGDG